MGILEWIRLITGGALLLIGLVIFLVELYGVFHFKYVLNRMHASAMGDTLGITCSLAGLMVLSGLNFATLKMALVILFLWVASPVSSHMLARLEVETNENIDGHCTVYANLSVLEAEMKQTETRESETRESVTKKSGTGKGEGEA